MVQCRVIVSWIRCTIQCDPGSHLARPGRPHRPGPFTWTRRYGDAPARPDDGAAVWPLRRLQPHDAWDQGQHTWRSGSRGRPVVTKQASAVHQQAFHTGVLALNLCKRGLAGPR